MKYLLDSNIVSDFYDKFSAGYLGIYANLSSLKDTDSVCISILTLYELEYGYANASDDKKSILRQKITEACQDFKVLSLSLNGSRLFGELKKSLKDYRGLKKENIKKHNIDIMIAVVAVTEGCILISDDAIFHDLQKLNPDLRLENWLL
ncbi:MAG: hypothetical protein DRI57_25220 [Deltaproteobacteria bacterium]|nr:MAG: hypothetical protein DRI57_25220 [Deltaproteobacteria bacterium]